MPAPGLSGPALTKLAPDTPKSTHGSIHQGLPRWAEVPIAGAALTVVAPIIALGALAMKVSSAGPAFFRQRRVGCGGATFVMWKLRTMRLGSGASVTAAGDPRITPVGGVLRAWKIDELPALWNVVRGDMALVGPRPEVPEYVDMRQLPWAGVLSVRPGITHPVTLRLRDEETLLARAAAAGEVNFYRSVLLPEKLNGYLEYEAARTWRSDIATMFSTVAQVVGIQRHVAWSQNPK